MDDELRGIANGAMDRVCNYDGIDNPYDYQEVQHRVGVFCYELVGVITERLAEIAVRQYQDGALADIDAALADFKRVQEQKKLERLAEEEVAKGNLG